MQLSLNIETATFKTEEGEEKEYYKTYVEICGETIYFFPKPEDKKLLKHLLKNLEEKSEE